MIEFPTGENIQAADKFDPDILKDIREKFEENYVPRPSWCIYTKTMYELMLEYYKKQNNADDLPTWEEFKKRDYVHEIHEIEGDCVCIIGELR